jgi:hypothetical protein
MRVESTDQEMIDRIVEAVHQAVREENPSLAASPPKASPAMISIIRKSRFFALLMKHLSQAQKLKPIAKP